MVGRHLRLKLDLVFDLLAGQVLVHEAFAGEVEIEVAVDAHYATPVGSCSAAHVMHARAVVVLDACARPSGHLVSVANVCGVAFDVFLKP